MFKWGLYVTGSMATFMHLLQLLVVSVDIILYLSKGNGLTIFLIRNLYCLTEALAGFIGSSFVVAALYYRVKQNPPRYLDWYSGYLIWLLAAGVFRVLGTIFFQSYDIWTPFALFCKTANATVTGNATMTGNATVGAEIGASHDFQFANGISVNILLIQCYCALLLMVRCYRRVLKNRTAQNNVPGNSGNLPNEREGEPLIAMNDLGGSGNSRNEREPLCEMNVRGTSDNSSNEPLSLMNVSGTSGSSSDEPLSQMNIYGNSYNSSNELEPFSQRSDPGNSNKTNNPLGTPC